LNVSNRFQSSAEVLMIDIGGWAGFWSRNP